MRLANLLALLGLAVAFAARPGYAQQIGGGSCSAASLSGNFALTFNGRGVFPAGGSPAVYQSIGSANFDGVGKVTFTVTANTNTAQNKPFTYSGTYSVPSNCFGTATINITGSPASFTLNAWNNGLNFNITGADATYAYSGSGAKPSPLCAVSTLSGPFVLTMSGSTIAAGATTGVQDEDGLFQFDGAGNVTAKYTTTSVGKSTPTTATGTYTVSSGCVGSATLTDSSGTVNAFNFSISTANGANFDVNASNAGFLRSGTGHAAFLNPLESIANVASYAVNFTPPGSVFVLFGVNLATRSASPVTTTLPTTLLNTTVTVNGEKAPLFYVDANQIDAQMPWDIPGNSIATVVVTNGADVSNAAAVYVPAVGTPGLSMYGNNRAVVVNPDFSVNSASVPSKVGDEVVAYYTGGGPVQAAGKLTSGTPAPGGLSPTSGTCTVMVGGSNATVKYCGLTPGGIGLYQVNFIVPQLAKGAYPVILTIGPVQSNAPIMNVQ